MRLGGLQKMTLLDFPGRVACTVFTAGCNFRCPFCHNTPLVLTGGGAVDSAAADNGGRAMRPEDGPFGPAPTGADGCTAQGMADVGIGRYGAAEYPSEAFFRFLQKRQGLLDGVAITGGEPLLHRDAADFIRQIRSLGYAVKLDTNGAFPDRLREILEAGLVDYVAIDVKNSREKYGLTAGVAGTLPAVERSIRLLMDSGVDYEFRTTLVDELHEPADFAAIGQWIAGAKRYFIQQFVDSGDILGGENRYHAASDEKAQACLAAVRPYLPNAALRGR